MKRLQLCPTPEVCPSTNVPEGAARHRFLAVLCIAVAGLPGIGYCAGAQQRGVQGLLLQRQQQQDQLQLHLKQHGRNIQNPPGSPAEQRQRQLTDLQQRQQQQQLDRRQTQQLQQSGLGLHGQPEAVRRAQTQIMQQRFARERQQQQLRFEQQWQQPPYRATGDSPPPVQPLRTRPAPARP